MQRRTFLRALACAPLAAALPQQAAAALDLRRYWADPRADLWLYRPATGEESRLTFWNNGLERDGYVQACRLLRDTQAPAAQQVVQIDLRLLSLLRAMQGVLADYGIDEPLHVLSGYRTRAHNARLEGAAKQSMHLYGKAADLRVPGLSPDLLGRIGALFGAGGVGFYVDRGFVHVDTGRIRYWGR